MIYQIQTNSDRGAFRSNNEDAVKYGEGFAGSLIWLVVADGMGGHSAGEVASAMLVEEIQASFEKIAEPEKIDWLCWLEIEVNRANNKIFATAQKNPEKKGMGTTAVVVVLFDNQCYIAWVGDSRCYLYNTSDQQALTQLTTDHTLIQALLDKGAITQIEADNANNKNMLSKAIGIKKGVDVDTKSLPIHIADSLLLSTDGLHDSLSVDQLSEFMQAIAGGTKVGPAMVDLAIENGSKDNITFASITLLSE